jgi:hypothetical protein
MPAQGVVNFGSGYDVPTSGNSFVGNFDFQDIEYTDRILRRVGIGTMSPSGMLEVNGKEGVSGSENLSTDGYNTVVTTTNASFADIDVGTEIIAHDQIRYVVEKTDDNTITIDRPVDWGTGYSFIYKKPLLKLSENGTNRLVVSSDGYLGINTISPSQLLDVKGDAIIQGDDWSSGHEARLHLGDSFQYLKSVWGAGVRIGTYDGASGSIDAICVQQVTGNVGLGLNMPTNLFETKGSLQYNTGIASRNAYSATIVGQGTAFSSAMVGSIFVFSDGTTTHIIGFTDSTHITCADSSIVAVAQQGFAIYYPGVNIKSDSSVGIGTTSPTEKLEINGYLKLNNAYSASTFKKTGGKGILLAGEAGSDQDIEWVTSDYVDGYGFRLYAHNPNDGNGTCLRIAARQNNASWTDYLTVRDSGKIGIRLDTPINLIETQGSLQYDTGTASRDNYTITGNGNTAFTSAMEGGIFVFNGGKTTHITHVDTETQELTVTDLGNEVSQGFKIYYAGFNVKSDASVGVGTITPGSKLQVNGNTTIGCGAAAQAAPANGLLVNGPTCIGVATTSPGTNTSLLVYGGAAIGYPASQSTPTNGMLISGDLGIGLTSPGSKLQVNGNAAIGYPASQTSPTNGLLVSGPTAIGVGTTSPGTNTSLLVNNGVAIGYSAAQNTPSNGLLVAGAVGLSQTSPASGLHIGANAGGTGKGYITLEDVTTAPGAPGTSKAVIYLRNGSLRAKFGTSSTEKTFTVT